MPRLSLLAKVPTDSLKRELSRRLERLPKLIAARDDLNRQIAELEGMAPAEAAPAPEPPKPPAPKKRGRKAKKQTKDRVTLAGVLADVIKTKESMSIGEAVEGVLATGYQSKSKDFPNLVSLTLSQNKRFQRVGRGVYRVKG